ncbi:MAG: hypothetical protein AAGJ10_07850 [Bacteroidota bacterium]
MLYDTRFETPVGRVPLSVGWALTDLGPHTQHPDSPQPDPLPMLMRSGLSVGYEAPLVWLGRPAVRAQLDLALSKLMVRVARDPERGTSDADAPLRALFTTWQPLEVLTPNGSMELSVADQLMRHRGLGLAVFDVLAFRWGHELNGARQYRSYGWGVDLYYVTLDYSRVQDEDVTLAGTSFWRLGARVPLTAQARADDPWRALWRVLKR